MARARYGRARADGAVRRRHHRLHRHRGLRHPHPHGGQPVAVAAGSDDDLLHLRRFHRHGRGDAPQRPPVSRRARRVDDRLAAPCLRDVQPPGRAHGRGLHDLLRLPQLPRRLSQPADAVDDAARQSLCRDPAVRRPGRALYRRAARERLAQRIRRAVVTANGLLIFLMAFAFLFLGYLGVPVAFALIAGVLAVAAFTPVRLASLMAQLFNGIDVEALLAVPFFLLVGELMTAANVTARMISFSQALIGHVRGGLAQVVTLFSMFFAGISGSSAADVAVLSRTLAPEMKREGYTAGFIAALIASASTMANLIPPSIMAVVYGATGNVSIGGLFLGGVVPGLLVGIGLMIYSYFFGPIGVMRPRATFGQFGAATREAAIPLMIPLIIMGGILGGQFTPTEAGIIAVAYIVFVAIPLLNPRHFRHLPRDMAMTGLLYSIPLITIGAASVFGWMLAYLRGPAVVSGWISSAAGGDPFLIMLLLVALFVIVGDFIDAIPAIIIFMPIITELTKTADINPVHMGVVIIVTLAFGLITPPYGIALLMASKFIGVRFGRAMLASFPIYVVFLGAIVFCIFFPDVVLWLPKRLLPESVGCFRNPSGAGYICP